MSQSEHRTGRGLVMAALVGGGFLAGVLISGNLNGTAHAEADPVFAMAAARPIRAVAVESDGWAIAECNGIYFAVNSKGQAYPVKFPSDRATR